MADYYSRKRIFCARFLNRGNLAGELSTLLIPAVLRVHPHLGIACEASPTASRLGFASIIARFPDTGYSTYTIYVCACVCVAVCIHLRCVSSFIDILKFGASIEDTSSSCSIYRFSISTECA